MWVVTWVVVLTLSSPSVLRRKSVVGRSEKYAKKSDIECNKLRFCNFMLKDDIVKFDVEQYVNLYVALLDITPFYLENIVYHDFSYMTQNNHQKVVVYPLP